MSAVLALTLHKPPREHAGERRDSYWTTLGQGLQIAVARPVVRYQVLFGAVTLLFPFQLTFVFFQPYATEVGLPIWLLGPLALVMRGGAMAGSFLANRDLIVVGGGELGGQDGEDHSRDGDLGLSGVPDKSGAGSTRWWR